MLQVTAQREQGDQRRLTRHVFVLRIAVPVFGHCPPLPPGIRHFAFHFAVVEDVLEPPRVAWAVADGERERLGVCKTSLLRNISR